MDAVTDLAARAVSFITLIQDTLITGSVSSDNGDKNFDISTIFSPRFRAKFVGAINAIKKKEKEKEEKLSAFESKVIELVWISKKAPDEDKEEKYKEDAEQYVIKLSEKLVDWVRKPENGEILQKVMLCGSFPTAYSWRDAICDTLYAKPAERIAIATALEYLPIQVVLALGAGKCDVREQRLFQMWKVNDKDEEKLLSKAELKTHDRFKTDVCNTFVRAACDDFKESKLSCWITTQYLRTAVPGSDAFRYEEPPSTNWDCSKYGG
jgi:hypothetical protein